MTRNLYWALAALFIAAPATGGDIEEELPDLGEWTWVTEQNGYYCHGLYIATGSVRMIPMPEGTHSEPYRVVEVLPKPECAEDEAVHLEDSGSLDDVDNGQTGWTTWQTYWCCNWSPAGKDD